MNTQHKAVKNSTLSEADVPTRESSGSSHTSRSEQAPVSSACDAMQRDLDRLVTLDYQAVDNEAAIDHLLACPKCQAYFREQVLARELALPILGDLLDSRPDTSPSPVPANIVAPRVVQRDLRLSSREIRTPIDLSRDLVSYYAKKHDREEADKRTVIAATVADILFMVFYGCRDPEAPLWGALKELDIPRNLPPCIYLDAGTTMTALAEELCLRLDCANLSLRRDSSASSDAANDPMQSSGHGEACHLEKRTVLSIATHNNEAAAILGEDRRARGFVDVLSVGGKRNHLLNASYFPGPLSPEGLPVYGANVVVLGTSGVTPDGIWASGQPDESPVKRRLFVDLPVRLRILAVQDSKLGAFDALRICRPEEMLENSDYVIVVTNQPRDDNPSAPYRKTYEALCNLFSTAGKKRTGKVICVQGTADTLPVIGSR